MKIEELRELTFLDDWLPHASRIDADSVGLNGETPILHAKRAGDQLAGAEKLADLDDRRAAQRGGQRQMELLERTHPFVTADCRKTLRPESVRDENGGRFAEPDHPRVGAGVLEREDEDAGLGRRRSGRRRGGRLGRDRGRQHQKQGRECECSPRHVVESSHDVAAERARDWFPRSV